MRTWDDSSSSVEGVIIIQSADGSDTSYASMQVTGVSEASGYFKIDVTPLVGSGNPPFSNGERIVLEFNRTGDKGVQGGQGVQAPT